MLTGEILAMTHKVSRNMDRALTFDETNHLRYRILRRNRDQHMHMINSKMTLDNLTLFLNREFPEC